MVNYLLKKTIPYVREVITMSEITTTAVAEKLKKGDALHMIDVREDEEVEAGAIPGVHHIPLGDLSSRLDRSEERRVGKEWRCWWWSRQRKRKREEVGDKNTVGASARLHARQKDG